MVDLKPNKRKVVQGMKPTYGLVIRREYNVGKDIEYTVVRTVNTMKPVAGLTVTEQELAAYCESSDWEVTIEA